MSVFIKGMEMPKNCNKCKFGTWSSLHQTASCKLHDYAPCFSDHSREYVDKRADFCPLVGIPEPHGNLIDADEFAEGIMHEAEQYWGLLKPETREMVQSVCKDIRNYPAVIPREAGENHDD